MSWLDSASNFFPSASQWTSDLVGCRDESPETGVGAGVLLPLEDRIPTQGDLQAKSLFDEQQALVERFEPAHWDQTAGRAWLGEGNLYHEQARADETASLGSQAKTFVAHVEAVADPVYVATVPPEQRPAMAAFFDRFEHDLPTRDTVDRIQAQTGVVFPTTPTIHTGRRSRKRLGPSTTPLRLPRWPARRLRRSPLTLQEIRGQPSQRPATASSTACERACSGVRPATPASWGCSGGSFRRRCRARKSRGTWRA